MQAWRDPSAYEHALAVCEPIQHCSVYYQSVGLTERFDLQMPFQSESKSGCGQRGSASRYSEGVGGEGTEKQSGNPECNNKEMMTDKV